MVITCLPNPKPTFPPDPVVGTMNSEAEKMRNFISERKMMSVSKGLIKQLKK